MTKTTKARSLIGLVTSNAMKDTIVVKVERQIKHPEYNKYIKKTKKYAVHAKDNTCTIGAKVEIKECRPISKTKSWVLEKIIEQSS